MDILEKKFPNGALSLYIKLYCKRKSDTKSKSIMIKEAMKSWISLNKTEKQVFLSKYNELRNNYKKKIAMHLKNVEPYLKSKSIKPHNKKLYRQHSATKHETEAEFVNENKQNSSKIETEDPICNIQYNETTKLNSDDSNISQVIISEQSGADEVVSIPEPTPPKVLTAKDLFLMIKEREEMDFTWELLNTTQKRRYQYAVLVIKKNYLKKYIKYLEHLTSNKLLNHYRNKININN